MKLFRFLLLPVIAALVVASCDDNTSPIGSTLVTNRGEIVIDSTFTVTAQSVPSPVLRSRTISQLIGNIDARSFGTLRSDFVTQFMPTSVLDTAGITPQDVDSLHLILRFHGQDITGDSLVPMGLNVYALNRQLPYDIYTDFDPEGYYDPSSPIGTCMYTGNAMYNDSLSNLATHVISIPLPLELGRDLFNAFLTQPSKFLTPEGFAGIFPGVYVKGTFGSGRVTNIYNTRLAIYYHHNTTYYNEDLKQQRDTTYYYARVLAAASPEAVSNNCMSFELAPEISRRAATGEALVVSPLGLNARIKLPVASLVDTYLANSGPMSVLNTLTMSLPIDTIPNNYGIRPPQHLLMVLEKDFDTFFEEFKIPDDINSFILTYNQYTNSYVNSKMRDFILNRLKDPEAAKLDENSTFILVPVAIQTETYQESYYSQPITIVTDVLPEVATPAMARILPDKAKIILTYSRESIIN